MLKPIPSYITDRNGRYKRLFETFENLRLPQISKVKIIALRLSLSSTKVYCSTIVENSLRLLDSNGSGSKFFFVVKDGYIPLSIFNTIKNTRIPFFIFLIFNTCNTLDREVMNFIIINSGGGGD